MKMQAASGKQHAECCVLHAARCKLQAASSDPDTVVFIRL
jgi:hypothetical protein